MRKGEPLRKLKGKKRAFRDNVGPVTGGTSGGEKVCVCVTINGSSLPCSGFRNDNGLPM